MKFVYNLSYKPVNIRGVREPENIENSMVGTSREEVESSRVEIPESFEKTRLPVSRTTLQYCIAAYKICKYNFFCTLLSSIAEKFGEFRRMFQNLCEFNND